MTDLLKCACPDMFRYSTDNSLVSDRVKQLATSFRPLKEVVILDIEPHVSTQRLNAVENSADMQTSVVFIDVDVLVERAIVLITVRNSLYSSLNPTPTSDIRDLVDEMLVDLVSRYPNASLFCLVHDFRLMAVRQPDEVGRPDLDTHWAHLPHTHPFHPTYFGYQTGCQTGGALACWRDQLMFLYSVSKIFGDVFTRLSDRFLAFGRDFKVMCRFPLFGFCVEQEASLAVDVVAASGSIPPPDPYHNLHMNVVHVTQGACKLSLLGDEQVHISIMGQIDNVMQRTGNAKLMVVYETLWNTDALLDYCFTRRQDTVFDHRLLIKQRNYDGSVACLIDVGALRRARVDVLRTVATWRVISEAFTHKRFNEQDTRLNWIRSIYTDPTPSRLLAKLAALGLVVPYAGITAKSAEIEGKYPPGNFDNYRINNYLDAFPFYRYHRNNVNGEYNNKIAGDILLLGPKMWLVSELAVSERDRIELVRGTSYSADDVSEWILTEYAIAHKSVLLDRTVINWSTGFQNPVLYMYGSRWLLCGRSDGNDPREVMFNACQSDAELGIDTFRTSKLTKPRETDMFFDVVASATVARGPVISNTNKFSASLLTLHNYGPAQNAGVDMVNLFNGTLSASQQVCAYGCKRLKADAGAQMWAAVVKPNLVLFRDSMNAAYMQTMRLVVFLDVACRANGSSIMANNNNSSARLGQLARNNPRRIVAHPTTTARAGKRYHTWVFAVFATVASASFSILSTDQSIDSLKFALLDCRELVSLLTEKFPIIDGVTVRVDGDYTVNIFFDGWSTDAVAIYIAALALGYTSEQVDTIDASDVKINIADKMRRVMFFNIARRVY